MDDFKLKLEALEKAFGHSFEQRELLALALTHKSFSNENPKVVRGNNERLEFLGDSVIGCAVAGWLFEVRPNASEGELTKERAAMVCEGGLSTLANAIDLGTALRLGKGEEKTGGRQKPRLLSSAFEACIGALYLDAGTAVAQKLVRRLFEEHWTSTFDEFDPKSEFQELVQARGLPAPVYELLETKGPAHEQHFRVAVQVNSRVLSEGEGRSKGLAEREAAQKVLAHFDDFFPKSTEE